jgi:hypothetical protein
MSLRATLWALDNAPVEDPLQLLVLIALADEANDSGRNAAPAIKTLMVRARCSERTVRRKLRELQIAGVITEGDQRILSYLQKGHRPTVYDLVMTKHRGVTVTPLSDLRPASVTPLSDAGDSRPVTVTPLSDLRPASVTPLSDAGASRPVSVTPHPDPATPPYLALEFEVQVPNLAAAPRSGVSPSAETSSDGAADSLAVSDGSGLAALREAISATPGLADVSWRGLTPDEQAEIDQLASGHGIEDLVSMARRQARSLGSAPGHVRAWIPEWRDLTKPGTRKAPSARTRPHSDPRAIRVRPGMLHELRRQFLPPVGGGESQ